MNIPPPGSNHDYTSGGSLRASVGLVNAGGDPYGSYGVGDNYQSSDISDYQQQLQSYYQNLLSVYQQLAAGDPRRAQCEQYMQMAQQYAQEVHMQLQGGVQGPAWGDAGAQQAPFSIDYEDTNHIVSEQGASSAAMIGQNDPITKTVDFYQKHNKTGTHFAGASISVVETGQGTDDVKYEVTYTFSNGTTRKVIYHHIDREGFELNIQAPDPAQVHIDASVTADAANASKVTATELGTDSASSTTQAGDPPTRTDADGTRVYDGTDFNISPATSGTGHKTKVLASGEVSIYPNSNEELYVMDYSAGPPARYIVTVYANEADKSAMPPKIKDTISIDAALVDHVNFGGDPSRISFGPGLATAGHPDQLNTAATGANKVVIGSDGSTPMSGAAVDTNHPEDTPADIVEGNTATYNTSTDFDGHANFDDAVTTHEITAPGNVTIHGTSFADKMSVTYAEGPPQEWVVTVYKNGITDSHNANYKAEVFRIHGGANTKVVLDVMDSGSIINPSGKSAADATAAHVQIGIDGASAANPTDQTQSADEIISNLESAAGGKTDNQIVQAFKAAGFSYNTIQELKAAIASGEFPPSMNPFNAENMKKVIKGLYNLGIINDINGVAWDHNALSTALKAATPKVVSCLQALYPDANISTTNPNASAAMWRESNNITFNGTTFNWTSQTQGHQSEIDISTTSYDGSEYGETH